MNDIIIALITILFIILISIQYTLNLILKEIKQIRIKQNNSDINRLN